MVRVTDSVYHTPMNQNVFLSSSFLLSSLSSHFKSHHMQQSALGAVCCITKYPNPFIHLLLSLDLSS